MKIAVSTESTCDLTKELIEKYDVKVVSFSIILGDKEYKDLDLTPTEIFDFVDKNGILPKTTALNEFEYTEYFESLLKDYDAVVHIAMSSGISSSTSHAISAAEKMKNVFIVDSLSLTTGMGLMCVYARELANEGKSPEEIKRILDEKKNKVQVSFVIERLDYLFKGGRCNSLQLLGANVLKIRPKILVKDGKMIMVKKYRGTMEKVVETYCREALAEYSPDLSKAFLTYTTASSEMIENARRALKDAGFKTVFETLNGTTVSCHCGKNTIGIIFFSEKEI